MDSVTVPGAVASWVSMSERFGKLPFADLLVGEKLLQDAASLEMVIRLPPRWHLQVPADFA